MCWRKYSRARSAFHPRSSNRMGIEFRCWSPGIWISGRCMSCDLSRPTDSQPADSSALALTLRALRPLLSLPEVMELCINRPREAFVETRVGWRRESVPYADFEWCKRLAKLVANSTQQRIDAASPLLCASLPTGERI